MTLKVRGLDHLVLRVKDPAAMERFYVEVLGLTVERRADAIGLVQLRAGAQLVDLVAADGMLGKQGGAAPGAEGRNLDHFCLNLADFDLAAVIAHLEAHGVAVGESGRRYGAGGFGVSVYLTDPEGNGLELRG
ncbi:MAG TPA: VOC family protein [Caulobacteraceae bacterium]|nr:VOC family protein [Caulobacteraceae bacterium]